MSATQLLEGPVRRLHELMDSYGRPEVCVASILCDNHPPHDPAVRLVDADLGISYLTYGEVRERSERFAAALAGLGVEPGNRVATLMGKSADLVPLLLGIWRCGAVHVPLFTAFAPPAIEMRLRAAQAKVIVTDASHSARLADVYADCRAVTPDDLHEMPRSRIAAERMNGMDPFIIFYTSGTTGPPKGVPTAAASIAAVQSYLEYGVGVTGGDVYWNAADPGWAYGLYAGIVAPLAEGLCTTLLTAPFEPTLAWHVLDRARVTNFTAAPTAYRALRAAQPHDAVDLHLRCLSSAGEPLDVDTERWAQETLGCEIRDHYGQTELGMPVANAWHPALRRPIKPGSMGTPMPGWTVEVLREDRLAPAAADELGRVAIDIPNSPAMTFRGYHDAPEKAADRITPDGRWYLTGDTASRDEDGYLTFSSREDDVIIMAGYRIGPFEVESVLVEHPAVVEAAVVGVPDELRGEVLEAFVALRPGKEGTRELADELKRHVKAEYAAHAYPRTVHFIDALPRTPSGKVQRFMLRDLRREEAVVRSGRRR